MKVHALVIYSMLIKLALTALPLAFHSMIFAFAYPLASIDYYDGYVPVETTQNQSDSVPGDVIEARQVPGPAVVLPVGAIILIVVVEVMVTITYIEQDDPVRQ